jgi:mannosyltransferase
MSAIASERPAAIRRLRAWSGPYLVLAAIAVLATALRLYHVDSQSLWNDEAGSVLVAGGPAGDILDAFRPNNRWVELNPPLYFYTLHTWFAVFGVGGLQARLLSVTLGVLCVPLSFLLARCLFDSTTGLVVAFLLAVSQLGVMYSQEARGYELVLALFLAAVLLFQIAESRGNRWAWWGAGIAALLTTATHYHAVFGVSALALYAAIHRRLIPWKWPAGTAAAFLAVAAPWWLLMRDQVGRAARDTLPFYYDAGLFTPLSVWNRFNNGAVNGLLNSAPIWTFVVGCALFGVPLLVAVRRAWGRRIVFVSLLCVIPIAGALAATALFRVQFETRYIAYAIAPYYILVGAGITRLPTRLLRALVVVLIAVYSGYALEANYFKPYKEDYRGALSVIDSWAVATDCYAFVPFGGPPLAWPLYTSRTPDRMLDPTQSLPAGGECPRIWVVTNDRVPAREQRRRWKPWLSSLPSDYTLRQEWQFFWVKLQQYEARYPR